MLKNSFLVFILLLVCFKASAELSRAEQDRLSEYVKTYQSQTTIKGFLKATHNKVVPEVSAFLEKRAEFSEDVKLLKVQFDGKDTITFELGDKQNSVTFKSLAEGKLLVNHKEVKLSNQHSFTESWEILVKSFNLTPAEKSAYLDWLIPKAYADDNASYARLAVPGVILGGAAFLDFEKKWHGARNITGITILVSGIGLIDYALCERISSDRNICYKMEDDLNELLPSFPEQLNALNNKNQPPPACPTDVSKLSKESRRNFIEIYQTLESDSSYFLQQHAFCKGDKKVQLEECVQGITKAMQYLCIDFDMKDHKFLVKPRKPADVNH